MHSDSRTDAAPSVAPAAVTATPADVAPPASAGLPPTPYRPDIDGLRAVAVLAVVVYHAFPQALPGGFTGVDIFFVISGYLISTIVFGQLQAGRFSFAAFYARRVRRIFPALLLVLAAMLGFGWVAMLSDEYATLGKHVAAGMGFASNLLLWSESGYFDAAAHSKPLLHLWSLGIEEQFYIAWPLLAWLAFRARNGLVAMVATVLLASFALNIVGLRHDSVGTFYSPLSRAWELAAGGLLAWAALRGHAGLAAPSPARAAALSVAGLALVAAAVTLTRSGNTFPGWWAVLPVAGTVALIAAGPGAWINRVLLANPVAVWIGLISYPLYLWHWPALFVARFYADGPEPDATARVLAVAASFVLAALTYHGVERHVRHRRGRRPMAVLLAAAVLVAGAGAVVFAGKGLPERPVARASALTPAVLAQFELPWNLDHARACMKRWPFQGTWWFCMVNKPEPPTVVILGNSFANQLYPAFSTSPALAHHSILALGSCLFAGARVDPHAPTQSPCYGERPGVQYDYIDGVIAKEDSLRFAIIGGPAARPDAAYLKRLQRRVTFLERQGLRVIVIGPHVRIPFHPRECFRDAAAGVEPKDCTFPYTQVEAVREAFRPAIEHLAKTNPRVLFFDQNDAFCERRHCGYVHDGLPLFRDEAGHTSVYGGQRVEAHFVAWAREHAPELLAP